MQEEPYNTLNIGWKATCRSVFGREIGELEDYGHYLKEAVVGKTVRSAFSGKDVWVSSEQYCDGAKFFDLGAESGEMAALSAKPVDINSIKDIDSLLGAVKEKIVYGGNKVFGNSKCTAHSDSVMDSSFILNSSMAFESKCLAYTYVMQRAEYAYGCTSSGQSANIVRCYYNNSLNRCFELCATVKASDCYFSSNVWSCADCMFSFNLRNKSRMIANVQLDKDRYDALKRKLLSEIADELEKKKRLDYSIIDILNGAVA